MKIMQYITNRKNKERNNWKQEEEKTNLKENMKILYMICYIMIVPKIQVYHQFLK